MPKRLWTPKMSEYVDTYCSTLSDEEIARDVLLLFGVKLTKRQVASHRYDTLKVKKDRHTGVIVERGDKVQRWVRQRGR